MIGYPSIVSPRPKCSLCDKVASYLMAFTEDGESFAWAPICFTHAKEWGSEISICYLLLEATPPGQADG
jgi:hypothetical protein